MLHPPAWLARLGLNTADLAPFADELRVEGDTLLARHRNQRGSPIGWEIITPACPQPNSRYTVGGQGGAFRVFPTPCPRLVLTNGALQALAVAAFEGHRHDTAYVGLGGHPGAAARATLTNYLVRWGVQEVEHAFGESDAELDVYSTADTHIVGLAERRRLGPLGWGPMPPPGGCWLKALSLVRKRAASGRRGS
ncbi:hypothetical protein [Belnapia rosea]|uniref:hypothetical protein n=1 Tax=Belnapia rosea TaxID=938405 RepID=UPI000B84E7B6|nr:hypothetical protein [Belnapia rosea]